MKQIQFSISRYSPALQQYVFLFRTEWMEFNHEDVERAFKLKFPQSENFHILKNTRTLTQTYEPL